MSVSYELVPFHQHQLLTINQDGQIYVPLKPLVLAMGLPWEAQRQRVARDPVLSKGTCILQVPSAGGTQDALALRLERIPGFIATIPTGHIKNPETRDAVILFQEEAFDVLFAHFFGGRGKGNAAELSDRAARRRELPALLERLEKARHAESQRILHELVVRACEAEDIVPPALEAYHLPNRDDQEAEALLAQIDALVEAGTLKNMHRKDAEFIAVRRKDLAALGIVIRPTLGDALIRHDRYKRYGSVSIAGGGSAHCWVFHRA